MKYRPVTHVIFDMDGLLLNTEELYYIAFQNICTPYGKIYDYEMKSKIMGKKLEFCAEYIIKNLKLPITVEEFKRKMDEQFYDLFSQAQVLPGAKKLVNHLKKHNVPIALCTGSSFNAYKVKSSSYCDFFSHFSPKVFCGSDDEVKLGKPNPDAYEVTRTRFSPNIPVSESCLVFEDSPNGVQSAISANMQCVMVPDPRLKRELCKGATLVIDSLDDFKPEEFGLPAYD